MSGSDQETTMLSWKVEPLSPSGTPPPFDKDEEWLCIDQKPAIPEANELYGESSLYEEDGEEQLTRAQVASKFLEELELKYWIKEESFTDWFEEKIDIPIFEELPAPECGQNRAAIIYSSLSKHQLQPSQIHVPVQQQQQQQVLIQQQQQQQNVDATQTLLREFETVLGDVEACHHIPSIISTLTPPQSPPPNAKQHQLQQQQQNLVVAPNTAHLLVSLQPLQHQSQVAYVYEQQQHNHQQQHTENYDVSALPVVQQQQQQIAEHWNPENLSLVPLVHGCDVVQELTKVDEYMLSCTTNVPVDHISSASSQCGSSSSAPPSPCTSSNASCISSEDSADDPDWSFEPTSSGSGGRRASQTKRAGRRAASSKPYTRPNVEDKRVRKKEQNKNAATRYRQKKKQEIKDILGEERELSDKNEELRAKLKDLQLEMGYLKGIMRAFYQKKGLIK
ncbi:basic-leucine zipper transcription factor A-like isoform X2 [Copidosoma floridanum]|uniref:basic-leucine zipper transcription factor A-like isoform X2 n=1 Tax=Copidosoma floridanum TaxID=29053 RepID=UPI000C6F8CFC|nr:basic-leucine zipper transcription factor A-like isoform X2 [Copidosoma floridanum]